MTRHLLYNEKKHLAHIIFNRPEKRNALSRKMWLKLREYMENACRNNKIKAILLYGVGGSFSAGDDIKEMYNIQELSEAREYFKAHLEAFKRIIECQKPIIAAVDGFALGGGAEILLATDLVVASKNSIIGCPEIKIGLIPPVLSTLGVYILGVHTVRRLALTGEALTAEQAYQIGLVDYLVEENPTSKAEEIISQLLYLPGSSVSKIKKLTMLNLPIEEMMNKAIDYLAQRVVSMDAKRLMEKFLNR